MSKKSFVIVVAGFVIALIGAALFKTAPIISSILIALGLLIVFIGPEL